jgi:hypothetical protein
MMRVGGGRLGRNRGLMGVGGGVGRVEAGIVGVGLGKYRGLVLLLGTEIDFFCTPGCWWCIHLFCF